MGYLQIIEKKPTIWQVIFNQILCLKITKGWPSENWKSNSERRDEIEEAMGTKKLVNFKIPL